MVPRQLIYASEAADDLKGIGRWLRQPGSGAAANRRLRAIRAVLKRLKPFPCLYPVVRYPGVREMPCDGGYRALYRVHPDTGNNETAGDVRVLRVFGPGQSRDQL